MMKFTLGIVLIGCMCLALPADGQSPKVPAKLLVARANYQRSLGHAQVAYDGAVKQATKEHKQELTTILDEETKAGNLDAALLVREEIKSLDMSQKVATKADLKKALIGSRWEWGDGGDGPITFQANGYVRHPVWDGYLVTRWVPIDRRTVVLVVEKGRDKDRLAILEFSEALDEYGGFSFVNAVRLDVRKRLPAGK